jgi:hypothetical protein
VQVVSKLFAGSDLTIIQLKELDPLECILKFDEAGTVRALFLPHACLAQSAASLNTQLALLKSR